MPIGLFLLKIGESKKIEMLGVIGFIIVAISFVVIVEKLIEFLIVFVIGLFIG